MATNKAENVNESTGELATTDDAPALMEAFDVWSSQMYKTHMTQTRDDLDQVVDFDRFFAESGLTEEQFTFQGSSYRVLAGAQKEELVNRPVGLRAWRFKSGDIGEYVVVYAVLHGTNEHVIFTDGSTGIYRTLSKISTDRLNSNHPAPFEYLKVPNGLRVSEYGLNAENRPAQDGEEVVGRGRTFYLQG